jgi:hypothetical protein|tara:strand:+ start:99 stop:464 length:366 start_codon:yes stop_codon:yes gene_type:complete
MEIFISGNTPSSKNSQQWTGRYLIKSKATQQYIKASKQEYLDNTDKFLKMVEGLDKPYNVEFTFIRKSKHRFDYINAAQIVQDLMVKYDWIDDDNMMEMKPFFADYKYDKENPGTIIKIIK